MSFGSATLMTVSLRIITKAAMIGRPIAILMWRGIAESASAYSSVATAGRTLCSTGVLAFRSYAVEATGTVHRRGPATPREAVYVRAVSD
ncbi:hypothetical protein GCM10023205_25760 [Yinghuangia aomiensis]|uniref:Secreted protein n=1 Tax=Yinghuangia aomiensis TaxID=676205 RepID=A0ABP9H3N5_9ACTN